MIVGKIKEVKGQLATVDIERQEMCGECHACDIVGEKKACTIKCENLCKGKTGDSVEIVLEEQTFLKATGLMYGVPLLGLILGLGIGYLGAYGRVGQMLSEIIIGLLGLLGMGIGFFILSIKEKKKEYQKFLPRAVKIVNK